MYVITCVLGQVPPIRIHRLSLATNGRILSLIFGIDIVEEAQPHHTYFLIHIPHRSLARWPIAGDVRWEMRRYRDLGIVSHVDGVARYRRYLTISSFVSEVNLVPLRRWALIALSYICVMFVIVLALLCVLITVLIIVIIHIVEATHVEV